MNILFIALNSPSHFAIWNYLSVEALIGHINGVFGSRKTTCKILYCNSFDSSKPVIKEINSNKYDLIGFSVLPYTLELLQKILQNINKIKAEIIFGNQLATYSPEYIIRYAIKNKNINYQNVFCVLGEGEETVEQLINVMLKKSSVYAEIESIKNICYYDGLQFHLTQLQAPDLSKLHYPPKYDISIRSQNIVEKKSKNKHADWVEHEYFISEDSPKINRAAIQMQLSRGCFWGNCSYCTRSSFRHGEKWKSFGINRIEKDLKNVILKLKYKVIEFSDDEFFGGRDKEHITRINKIIDIIENINNKIEDKISFRIFTRPDIIYKKNESGKNKIIKETLARMQQQGLDRIYIGIESGSCKQLSRYNRGLTEQSILKSIQILKEINLPFDCGFMLFDPLLTLDELIDNINFYLKHDLIRGNQWFWRPVIINKGSTWGDDKFEIYNKGKYNPNTMSYEYEINDKDVKFIADFIDLKTKETREQLYTIKQISKTDLKFNNRIAQVAKKIVEKNGLIYVNLIRDLAIAFKNSNNEIEQLKKELLTNFKLSNKM
ncbi:MAG: hypothetical protein A2X13_07280 [Bacteroidetes bacterium GWC2_33_15]|nr:MAG: hypothetical protein A2X10_01135 [Bacteroidetes bacterium GWA2_33_15]OFX48590.1 MAG: hypothetical protein A2X13_07280 [Bacteroidetes bacterium GWC2_33_15]OFX64564.1 MAG: hypothetical protein A2X15_04870 [Bacteroidetes bacterium GWB2_32_14]OFX68018.1 MAG: hypothetical protein A2X14_01905 [Bacteroidetes bacterium GWD2_33_33]HAN18254.1 hypothetical protein [Bacteroidales bacterium]